MASKVVETKAKTTKNPFDFTLCITVILLLALGLVMVMSASAPTSLSVTGNSWISAYGRTIEIQLSFLSKII